MQPAVCMAVNSGCASSCQKCATVCKPRTWAVSMTYSMTPHDQMSACLPSYDSVSSTCSNACQNPEVKALSALQGMALVCLKCRACCHHPRLDAVRARCWLQSYAAPAEQAGAFQVDMGTSPLMPRAHLGRHVLRRAAGRLAHRPRVLVLGVPKVAHLDDGQRQAAVQQHIVQLQDTAAADLYQGHRLHRSTGVGCASGASKDKQTQVRVLVH